jgi:hypothetical protein
MGGDEIVADWLGNVYSQWQTTSNVTVNRFYATSKRFRSFHIYNTHNVNGAYIGQYDPALSTFGNRAIYLHAFQTMKLEFVDIHELGYLDSGSHVVLMVLGLNEY